jgi:hypothetical protein
MDRIILLVPRVIAGMCAVPVGALCAWAALQSGMEQAGTLAGVGFASIVVAVWFLPAIIRSTVWALASFGVALLAIGAIFGAINAIGYAAQHRSGSVGTSQNAIEAHTRAAAALARLQGELEAMQRHPKKPGEDHPRWVATAGCSNATVPESEAYCKEVTRVRGEMADANTILAKPKPLSADPMAESIAALTGIPPATFNRWWPIAIALVAEIFATGLMTMAFAPIVGAPVQQAEPIFELVEVTVEPEPVPEPEPEWLAADLCRMPFPRLTKHTAHLTPIGIIDGRSLRHLPMKARNDNTP